MKEGQNCIITLPYDISAPLREVMTNLELFTQSLGAAKDIMVGTYAGPFSGNNTTPDGNFDSVDPYKRYLDQTIYSIGKDIVDPLKKGRAKDRARHVIKTASAIWTHALAQKTTLFDAKKKT